MKFRGVLVKPLAEQRDRDEYFIDPAGVEFPDEEVPIFREFNYKVPDDQVGTGRISRSDDGSLVVEGELFDRYAMKLAIGVVADGHIVRADGSNVIAESKLMGLGLTNDHKDPTQPEIEIIE